MRMRRFAAALAVIGLGMSLLAPPQAGLAASPEPSSGTDPKAKGSGGGAAGTDGVAAATAAQTISLTGGPLTITVTDDLSCDVDHIEDRKGDGTVWGWGNNGVGQLGDGTNTSRTSPVRVGTLTDVTNLAAGAHHSLALRSDGTLYAWGYNLYGQLGDGTTTNRTSPVQVPGLSGIAAIAGGAFFSLAATGSGT